MAKRRLAAIMFTDIVGYSALLEQDEKEAFETLRKNQRIQKRLIKKSNGRWLKEMESSALASFSSIIDAVMCALSIQKAAEGLNIPLRIGIHLGEVIFEKKDVLGDGVNLASRIQNAINTSGIVISEKVYSDIKNKEGLDIESLGRQTLKGVDSPLGIYKVSCHDESILDFTIDTGELVRPLRFGRTILVAGIIVIALLAYAVYYFLPKTSSRPHFEKGVLILPFDNFTSDTLDYYTAGMHNALIIDVGKISALKVISKTTARAYKNIDKSMPEIASELGVNAIIEGAVTCLGDSVCLQIKMKNADDNEKPLWIQDFYVEKSQILSLYNNVAKEILDKININLTPEDERKLSEFRTVDPEAYAAYLKGQQYWEQLSEGSMKKALEYFQIAIEKDPNWAPPYAGLSLSWGILGAFGYMPMTATLPNQYNYLDKALELDPNSAEAHYAAALTATWMEWDWEKGEKEFLKSLDLHPNNPLCRVYYAHLLMILNRFDEAIYHANLAVETDPLSLVLGLYGEVMNGIGDYQSARRHGERALSIDPENGFAPGVLDGAYFGLGNYDEWFNVWKRRNIELWEAYGVTELLEKVFHEQGYLAVIKEAIRLNEEVYAKDGLMHEISQASRYLKVKNYEKALDYFEQCYETHYWQLAYISLDHFRYPELKDNSRYIALLRKMNLPLP